MLLNPYIETVWAIISFLMFRALGVLQSRTESAAQIPLSCGRSQKLETVRAEIYDVQGSLDASTEELALCSSIANFRNCIFTSEPAWSSHDVRGFTDTLILQLFDVRCCLAALVC